MFGSDIFPIIMTQKALLNIRTITIVQFFCLLTLNDVDTIHTDYSIEQSMCWDYRELANLSAGYARLRSTYQGITDSFAANHLRPSALM